VAFDDFLTLSANFGAEGVDYTQGNIDLTEAVAFADFLVLSENFGKTPEAGAAVPEPSSSALVCLGVLLLGRIRRRRRLSVYGSSQKKCNIDIELIC
jgi:hypothetical protein